jgi:hypothetical protein
MVSPWSQCDIHIHVDVDVHYAPHDIKSMLSLMAKGDADIMILFGLRLFQAAPMWSQLEFRAHLRTAPQLHSDADDFPSNPKPNSHVYK